MKKIFAMLVMTLFMISMVPMSFADTLFDRKVLTYVKENSEKLKEMGLNGCVAHISTEFQNVGKKKATAYCKEAGRYRDVNVAQVISKIKPLIKAKDKIDALNIETSKKELFMGEGISHKISMLSKEDAEKLSKLKPNTIAKLKKLDRNQLKAILKKPLAEQEMAIAQAIEDKDKIKRKAMAKRLVGNLEKVNAIKASDNAREAIRLEKIELKPIRNKFLSLKPKIKACAGDTSVDCIKTREDMAKEIKRYLRSLVKMLDKNLEKVANKVSASEAFTDEQVNTIKTEWHRLQEMIGKLKEEVDGITAKSDKSEINSVTQHVKKVTREVRVFVKKVQTLFQEKKVVTVLAKFEALEQKLDDILRMMKERGMSTERIDELIDDFSNHIQEARGNYRNALTAKEDGDNEGAMSYFTISKGAFKKAHVVLKQIAEMVRKAGWHIQASPISIKDYAVDDEDITVFSEMIITQENLRKGHDLTMDGKVDVADVVKLTSMVDFLDSYLSPDGKLDKADAKVFEQMITVAGNVDLGNTNFDINEDGTVDVRDLVKFINILKNFDLA